MDKEVRSFILQPKYYNGRYNFTSQYPFLRLAGRWMAKAGFEVGGTVKVRIKKNKLIITKKTINYDKSSATNQNGKRRRSTKEVVEQP